MFTKRLFEISLLGVALFTLLALVSHRPGLLADIATSAQAAL